MKLFLVLFVSALALSAADPQDKKPTPQAPPPAGKAAPKAAETPRPARIPVEAVRGDDGDYRYTDPQGKKWLFRQTPFGVTRMADTPERAAAEKLPVNAAGIKATEDGDKVRFERLGPFGVWKWEKKKSELDETEKAALQNSQANHNTVSKQD